MFSYQHHIGDFVRDTARLSDSQCMAYLRLIWMYYDTESPIPNNPDKVAFQIGSTANDVSLILGHFFFLEGDSWLHKRCEAEIEAYRKRADHGRKAASARWKNARAMPEHAPGIENNANREPITDNREPLTNKDKDQRLSDKSDDCPLFDDFWKLYPRKEDKKKAKTAFCRLSEEKKRLAMNDCCVRYKSTEARYIPLPTTYIHGERWNDEMKPQSFGAKTPARDDFDSKDYGEGGLL